jgi:hypothetical protein
MRMNIQNLEAKARRAAKSVGLVASKSASNGTKRGTMVSPHTGFLSSYGIIRRPIVAIA